MTSKKPSSHRILIEKRILCAAETAFANKGFSGTSMDEVAEGAGLSKQNLIYYFRSKKLLYRRVLEEVLNLWVEKMQFDEAQNSAQAGQSSPAEVMSRYIHAKLELSRDFPEGSRIFAHEVINGAPVLRDYLETHLKPQFEHDVALVKRWKAQGLIDPQTEPEHLFFMLWATTQTYADFACQIKLMLNKTELTEQDFSTAAAFLTRLVLGGLGVKQD